MSRRTERTNRKLSASQTHASDDFDSSLFCQPCELDNKQEPAYGYCQDCVEHLCETCFRTHRKPAPSRNHVLLNYSDMPKSRCGEKTLVTTCQQHIGKEIEYLCKDHNILGCSPCVTIHHRNCRIVYIKDIAKQFQTSDDYKKLLQDISALESNCKLVFKQAEVKTAEVEQNKYMNKARIQRFRQQINYELDKWEKHVYQENESLHGFESVKATSIVSGSKELLGKAEKLKENLTMLQRARNESVLYIKAKNDAEILKDYQNNIREMQNNLKINEYEFSPNKNIQKLLTTERSLGEFFTKPRNTQAPNVYTKPSNQRVYSVQSEKQQPRSYTYVPGKITTNTTVSKQSENQQPRSYTYVPGKITTNTTVSNSKEEPTRSRSSRRIIKERRRRCSSL